MLHNECNIDINVQNSVKPFYNRHTPGRMGKPRSPKHTSCSCSFLNCSLFIFPIEEDFYQNVKNIKHKRNLLSTITIELQKCDNILILFTSKPCRYVK